jgi:PAS domain S-box-containing protein
MNIHPDKTQNFYQTINVLLSNVYGHSEEEGFALVNIMGQIIMANKVFCEASGYTEQEVLQLTAPSFFPGDLNAFIELVKDAKSGRIEWKNRIMLGKGKRELNVDVYTNYLQQGTGLFCCFFEKPFAPSILLRQLYLLEFLLFQQ